METVSGLTGVVIAGVGSDFYTAPGGDFHYCTSYCFRHTDYQYYAVYEGMRR